MQDNIYLKQYMDGLSISDHKQFVSSLMAATGLSRAFITNWKNKVKHIHPIYKMIIEKIACKTIFPEYEKPQITISL